MHLLSIIIVNFNTRDLLIDCLRSVYCAIESISCEVWVVDNASADGSSDAVRAMFPQVNLIENSQNIGFAKANNQALRQAKGRICLLLNSDTLVDQNALKEILRAFEINPSAGIIGSQLLNKDRSIQPSCGAFVSLWTELFFQSFLYKIIPSPFPLGIRIHPWQQANYQSPHQVDWVSGACLSIRRDVAEKVGLLDESIFMYGEDMEWCWQVRQAGDQVIYWPEARVVHLLNQSSRLDFERWIENYTTAKIRFVIAHHSRVYLVGLGCLECIGSILRRGIWSIILWFKPASKIECGQRILGYRKSFQIGMKAILKGTL
jgi:GT2 family glycosyltransferase